MSTNVELQTDRSVILEKVKKCSSLLVIYVESNILNKTKLALAFLNSSNSGSILTIIPIRILE